MAPKSTNPVVSLTDVFKTSTFILVCVGVSIRWAAPRRSRLNSSGPEVAVQSTRRLTLVKPPVHTETNDCA
jgi:hypothetical protein